MEESALSSEQGSYGIHKPEVFLPRDLCDSAERLEEEHAELLGSVSFAEILDAFHAKFLLMHGARGRRDVGDK